MQRPLRSTSHPLGPLQPDFPQCAALRRHCDDDDDDSSTLLRHTPLSSARTQLMRSATPFSDTHWPHSLSASAHCAALGCSAMQCETETGTRNRGSSHQTQRARTHIDTRPTAFRLSAHSPSAHRTHRTRALVRASQPHFSHHEQQQQRQRPPGPGPTDGRGDQARGGVEGRSRERVRGRVSGLRRRGGWAKCG